MIARRRCPRPTRAPGSEFHCPVWRANSCLKAPSSIQPSMNPSPSGPRCACRSFILCKAVRSMGTPSILTAPTMPHILFFTPRRRRLPRHRPVDVNHLLGEQPLVQALDRLTSSDPPAPSERPFKRGGDGFGPLVDADFTAFDALQSLPHVADLDRDDRQIASQSLLDHIRRSLLTGREDEDITCAHVDGDL